MKREKVYEAIDSERDYQDSKWKDLNDSYNKPADWALYIERHLGIMKEKIYKGDAYGTQEQMRKIAALCVAAGECLGMQNRLKVG